MKPGPTSSSSLYHHHDHEMEWSRARHHSPELLAQKNKERRENEKKMRRDG